MAKKHIRISKIINTYDKTITIEGDKSLSIRWALLASQAVGKSKSFECHHSSDGSRFIAVERTHILYVSIPSGVGGLTYITNEVDSHNKVLMLDDQSAVNTCSLLLLPVCALYFHKSTGLELQYRPGR